MHLDVLGWLHILWGVLGLLTGTSLAILSFATVSAFVELGATDRWALTPAAGFLILAGAVLATGGAAMAASGRLLLTRAPRSRHAVLALAVVNLFILPFGTALAVYGCWTLLNDDARRAFGRPVRAHAR